MQHLLNELVRLSPSWGNQSESPGLRSWAQGVRLWVLGTVGRRSVLRVRLLGGFKWNQKINSQQFGDFGGPACFVRDPFRSLS